MFKICFLLFFYLAQCSNEPTNLPQANKREREGERNGTGESERVWSNTDGIKNGFT